MDGLDGTPEIAAELSLFNRVGDLYLKEKQVTEAVDMYERAVTLYSEHGFPNNAIALCNKILRNAPSRTSIYLRLAELMLERGFVAEAKQNLLEYAERMQKAGKTDEAFRALKDFADLSPDNEEIRLMLAEQLKQAARTDEARDQLAKLYAEAEAAGDQRRTRETLTNIKAIDPEFDVESAPKARVKKKKQKTSELVFLDLGAEYDTDRGAAEPDEEEEEEAVVDGSAPPASTSAALEIESTGIEDAPADTAEVADEGLELESVAVPGSELDETPEVSPLEGLDVDRGFEAPADTGDVPVESLEIETTSLADDEEDEAAGEEDEAFETTARPSADLEALELEQASEDLELSVDGADDDDVLEIERASAADVEAVEEEDTVAAEGAGAPPTAEAESVVVPDLAEDEPIDLEVEDEGDMEVPELDLSSELEDEDEELEDLELEERPQADDAFIVPDESEAAEDEEPVSEVEEPAAEIVEPAAPTTGELEQAVAEDPDDPARHVTLGEALIGEGDRERGIEELGIAVQLHEAEEAWSRAVALTDEILRLDPNNVKYHQKQVELAFRTNDKQRLVRSYLGLADALLRSGAVDRAHAVYQRVLEHDEHNHAALQALETFGPADGEHAAEPAAPAAASGGGEASGDFVDLGALILEDEPVRDARMRIQEEEPTGDEERDFADMLSQFKRGIEENIGEEDWQAHYDLGVAFKEMGLVDEAIAEFQKALRAPAGRLKTAEALGGCFFEKEQYSVAATVMRRGVESDPSGDEAKIGLLYWLGRCEEAQEHTTEALRWYQRVFALDINFRDVSQRVEELAKAAN